MSYIYVRQLASESARFKALKISKKISTYLKISKIQNKIAAEETLLKKKN